MMIKVKKDILKDNQIKLTKYDVEEQNLIKIDLLCNRGLSRSVVGYRKKIGTRICH